MLRSPPDRRQDRSAALEATFRALPVLAVVRFHEVTDLDAVLTAIRRGGVSVLEVTSDTPGALDAVRRAAEGDQPVGAGTIRTPEQARAFAEAGAAFLVSPGFQPEVVAVAVDLGVEIVPGALSPTEVASAVDAGAAAVKLFPAGTMGTAYLRALRGPFADVPFVPTGGIEIDEVPDWLAAGAACVGLGSALVGGSPPRSGDDLKRLTDRARRLSELASGLP